ncbi:MAG: hypothetical protein EOM19_06400 [Candidatus Moranbacteria bacterium]|nr:hypothetical protein [Candidatus Moranbacteria bacterium]
MKRKHIIMSSILVLLSCLILVILGYKIKGTQSYTLKEIENEYPIINTPREAIEVLKQNNQINYSHLKEIESQINFEINWKFYVSQKENIWSIQLKAGVMPPYVCFYEMDTKGKPIHDEYLTECHWIGK